MPEASRTVVRPCRPEEYAEYFEMISDAFGGELDEASCAWIVRQMGAERVLAAFVAESSGGPETMAGVTGAFPTTLTVPGGEVSTTALAGVGVRPTHRRRGVLTAMLRTQLDDERRRGIRTAILWASEPGIYGRFGFGVATWRGVIDVEPSRARFRDAAPPQGRTRFVDADEALRIFPPIYDRIRVREPGFLARNAEWWGYKLLDDLPRRRPNGRLFRVVHELGGEPVGYAVYRLQVPFDDDGLPDGRLDVIDAQAVTPAATRELWEYLFGIELMERVRAYRIAPDHPLLLALADPRRLRTSLRDGIWLRLLDLPGALSARGYAAEGSLVLDVADDFFADQAGRWRLVVRQGDARVERTTDAPDLALDVEALGMAYLGGTAFGALARAGRVREQSPGAAARADALFHTPHAPSCADDF